MTDIPRTCDGCSACCHIYAFDDPPITKLQFETCSKLTECGLCSIYPERPATCVGFECGWLQSLLPEAYPPKDVGFVMSAQHFPSGLDIITLIETRPGAFAEETFEPLISAFVRAVTCPVLLNRWRGIPGTSTSKFLIGFAIEPEQYRLFREHCEEMGYTWRTQIPENPPVDPGNTSSPSYSALPHDVDDENLAFYLMPSPHS